MTGGKPDEIDYKILNILQRNSRIDMQELSRRVNLSRTPVSLRVEKLVETGIIQDFIAVVDRLKVNRPVLIITHVKLEKQTAELLLEFERWVSELPEVQCCLNVSGDWSFIIHVSAATPQDYYHFLMSKINSRPNVAHTDSSFVLRECKNYSPLPL